MLAHPAGYLEVGFDVNIGKAVPIADDQLGIIDAKLLGVPILDQAVEHVEIVGKIDDAGRVAVGKSDRRRTSTANIPERNYARDSVSTGRSGPGTRTIMSPIGVPRQAGRWVCWRRTIGGGSGSAMGSGCPKRICANSIDRCEGLGSRSPI